MAGLCIFAPTDRFLYATIGYRPVNRPDWGGFFVLSRIWPFLGVFRAFRGLDGTSYRPVRKSVLNRKFAENNFFLHESLKNNQLFFGNIKIVTIFVPGLRK